MEALQQNKTLLIILAVTVVGAGAYYLMSSSSTDVGLESDFGTASADAREVLDTLALLENIKLNIGLFQSEAFLSLSDYTITIPPVIPGRKDPFKPLPGLESAPAGSSSR